MTWNTLGSNTTARDHLAVVGDPEIGGADQPRPATIHPACFPEPDFINLFSCWQGFKGLGAVPLRSAIDPTLLPRKLLQNISIIERLISVDGERFRYRLAGTAIEQAAGRSLTWAYLDEILPAKGYGAQVHRQLRLLTELEAPVYAEGAYLTCVDDRTGLRTTCHLMLPLADDAGAIRYVLTAQTFGTLRNLNHAPFLQADDFQSGRMAIVRTR
ncbi:PAS domain-containing protein [Algihabitans albus]|uniref:PAS domain-containing protein n=1 Tax=Algihabitans albus TaxID=2164067 RepID=UPI0013C2D380|nr:PAS domain-containing protein [Algihabitans albus]